MRVRAQSRFPRAIAEAVLRNLQDPDGILARQEIAGPGFLNFSFAPKFFYREFRDLVSGRNLQIDLGHGEKIQVEFASVNPTGPLHVGHGRLRPALPVHQRVVSAGQYGGLVQSEPVKWDSAVLWNRWRLVSGKELYDIKADPDLWKKR